MQRQAVSDEVLGRIVVGRYELVLQRQAGIALQELSLGELPACSPAQSATPLGIEPLPAYALEIGSLRSLLHGRAPRVVEVSGPRGIGKTTLLRQIPDAIYVDARGLTAGAVLQRIFKNGFKSTIPYVPNAERLRELLRRSKPILLDGFTGSKDELRALLASLDGVSLAYTTIEPCELGGSIAEIRLQGVPPNVAEELFERRFAGSSATLAGTVRLMVETIGCNPQLLQQAAMLARDGRLTGLKNAAAVPALVFNTMGMREQQVFAAIAGFRGARPDRATVIAVAGVPDAAEIIRSLIARCAVETDGERLWLPSVMESTSNVTARMTRPEAMVDYAVAVLSQKRLPKTVTDNPRPLIEAMRVGLTIGRHAQLAQGGRAFVDALLLDAQAETARQVCELVRRAAVEARDQSTEAWAEHQLGTLGAILDLIGSVPRETMLATLRSAISRREMMGEEEAALVSEDNLELLQGKPRVQRAPGFAPLVESVRKIALFMGGAVVLAVVWAKGSAMWHAHPAYLVPNSAYAPASVTMRHHAPPRVAHAPSHVVMPRHALPPQLVIEMPTEQAQPEPPLIQPPAAQPLPAQPLAATLPETAPLVVERHQIAIPTILPVSTPTPLRPTESSSTTKRHRHARGLEIKEFTVTSSRIVSGQFVELCFRTAHAKSASIQPLGVLSDPSSGCVPVTPAADTTYTLTAYDAEGGSVSKSLSIEVLPLEGR